MARPKSEDNEKEFPSDKPLYFQETLDKLKKYFENFKSYVLKNKSYFIAGTSIFVILILALIIFRILHKRRIKKKKLKKARKKGILEINHIKNIQVYAGNGNSIGKVKEAHLKGNKIDGWLIKVKKNIAKKIGKKYILVKHNHVSSIGDVMIIDKIVAEHLERYSTPGGT